MELKVFEAHVRSQSKFDLNDAYCVIALNGEAGEIAEWYKKYVLRNNIAGKHTEADLLSELGDVLYYLTALAQNHGWTLEDVMQQNIKKIEDRHGKGFKQIV